MRILHLVHQYLPEHVGGTELYTHSVAHALSQRGNEVAVFHRCNRSGVGWESTTEDGVQVFRAWDGEVSPARRYLLTFGSRPLTNALTEALDYFQPNLIHVQHLMGLPADTLELVHRRQIPLVVTLWDYWWVCANANRLTNYSNEVCAGPWAYLNCTRCVVARANTAAAWGAAPAITASLVWRSHILRRALDRADMLIAPSRYVCDWYSAHGLARSRLEVIRPGVDRFDRVNYSPKPASPRGIRFLYLGGIAQIKGVHILLEAFRQVKGDAELWIGGNLSTEPAYSARLRALSTPAVHFLGRLNRAEVWQALAEVDVVLVPSLWHETFCLVAHEALAAGRPVVASRIGALPEAVNHGVDGLLVEPGDVEGWLTAMQQMMDDPSLLAGFRKGIRPEPTIDDHVSQLFNSYQRVVQQNG